jgi:hypothetical protein
MYESKVRWKPGWYKEGWVYGWVDGKWKCECMYREIDGK